MKHHHHHHSQEDHTHEHHEPHGRGHNYPHHGAHLHSHVHGGPPEAGRGEIKTLAASFVEGFRDAKDKISYLRLASIPFHRRGKDGLTLNLVDATIVSNWQIGTASPAFASRELMYLPFAASMVTERETMNFTYVSLTQREDVDLLKLLGERARSHVHSASEGPSASTEKTGDIV